MKNRPKKTNEDDDDPEFGKRISDWRNQNWARQIIDSALHKPMLVFGGASHFTQPETVLDSVPIQNLLTETLTIQLVFPRE